MVEVINDSLMLSREVPARVSGGAHRSISERRRIPRAIPRGSPRAAEQPAGARLYSADATAPEPGPVASRSEGLQRASGGTPAETRTTIRRTRL